MNNQITTCTTNAHDLSVCSVDGCRDIMDGYYFGVCLICGETFEVKYRQLEEVFKDGSKQ